MERDLVVASWNSPGRSVQIVYEHVEGAPSWWVSDEEASQSFINAMGVRLDG